MDGSGRLWAGVTVPVGASSWLLYSSGDAAWLLGMPILVTATLCTVAILSSVARFGAGGWPEDRVVRLGLLLAAMLSAAGFYEVLLYELWLCVEGQSTTHAFVSLAGAQDAYCGFLEVSGYWPAFVPALAVLLASTAALGRGPRPLIVASLAAVVWSVLFGLLPLILL